MKSLDLYYRLRPLFPRAWQIHLRRYRASRQRPRVGETWPILEQAGTPPEGWCGWPGDKRFAFVLTHDVETVKGLEKCRAIMDMEERLGFRSSFNFVPGRYEVPDSLRHEMAQRGFELGLHGLYHDGRLFTSRKVFRHRASRINDYLRRWGCTGFRSPSMQVKLDWLHELEIDYDSSTFDTDPFEPHPHGVGTIFPFRMNGNSRRKGYVELPYTLPQDFTLFVLLGEQGPSVWQEKLNWIAERGGMALLDTHPDYMGFGQGGTESYPFEYYEGFLKYVRDNHGTGCWQALPRDVARFCADHPGQIRRGLPKRICMLAYAFYETDNRIMRYAEGLTRRGDHVDVVALRREGHPRHEVMEGVHVFRIQDRQRNEKRPLTYLLRLLRFLVVSAAFVARKHRQAPYDVLHVHSVPDFEVFAAAGPKLGGCRVILDIHDIVPEFFASKFHRRPDSFFYKVLIWVEKLSTGFSDHVIIANHIWRDRLTSRSVPPEKCTVVLNYVDTRAFRPRPRTRQDDRFLIVYAGGMQWHQGLDIAIRAFPAVQRACPEAEFHIYGEGSEKPRLTALIDELRLQGKVVLHDMVPFKDIPRLIADADLGLVAKRSDSFGNEAFSTKIFEFMSVGVPLVVSRTQIDTFYFDDTLVKFFESGNAEELAKAIVGLARDRQARDRQVKNSLEHVARENWDLRKHDYFSLVDRLAETNADSRRRN